MMAIDVYDFSYNSYDKRVNGFKSFLNWDDIVEDSSGNGETTLKKYLDDSGEKWVGIKLVKSGSSSDTLIYLLSDKYSKAMTVYNYSYSYLQLNCGCVAISQNGFVLIGGNRSFPIVDSSSDSNFKAIGVWKSKNVVTGKFGYSVFGIDDSKRQILGDGTISDATSNSVYGHYKTDSGMILTAPITTSYSSNVIDDLLEMQYRPDPYIMCNMSVTYNDVPYRRLGNILVPENI